MTQQTLDVEKWLNENTFQCPLGRVSRKQCEALRNRPVFDPKNHAPITRPNDHTLYRPQACISCTLWKEHEGICKAEGCTEPAKVKGFCKKHYAQYYYRKNKEIGRKIREMSEKLSVCEDCGKEFQPYQRGRQVIRRVCRDCLARRTTEGRVKTFIHEDRKDKKTITVNLSAYPDVIEKLENAAIKHFRTTEHQALAYIVKGLEADGFGREDAE